MRLSKSDAVIFIIGLAILAVLGYLLYADIMDRSGLGSTKLIGQITSKRNTAERKFSSQVVWDDISRGSSLYNYDTVRTADRSEATIKLLDGTVINLSENSMILLAISEKEVDIKFIQGTMSAKQSGKKDGGAQKVSIQSGDSTVSLSNGDVSLSQDRDNQLQMTVNRGKATLKSGNQEKVINENQNILAGKDTIRLYDLNIKLISPDNNRYIPSTAGKTTVTCSWERVRGDYSTYLEIAANPALSDPFIKVRSNSDTAAAKLDVGVYYWRVTATNNVTKKIETSEIRKFTIVNDRPVTLISPPNRSVIKYRDAKPMINFIWSRNESVSRYQLMISSKPDMTPASVNTTVEGNKISLNSLGESTYFWKVVNISETDKTEGNASSTVNTFTVAKTATIEPPEPVYPPNGRSVHPKSIVQKGLNFTWVKDPSIVETKIVIAEDSDLSKVVINKRSKDTSYRLIEKMNQGTYYWGLRGVMSDGTMTDMSRRFKFKVGETGSIMLIEPADRAFIANKKDENTSDVNFSWSKTDLEGRYIVQMSKSRDFSFVVKEMTTSDLSTVIPKIDEGQYFWRVKLVDEKNEAILTSPINSFEVLSLLESPVVIGPGGGSTVNMLKKDTLDFSWRPVKGANLYRIGLFQYKGGIHHSIAKFETRNNAFRFAALNKLDEGRFMWTIQALEMDAASNRMKRRSEETRAIFEITLGIKKDLKLDSNKILNTE